VRSGPRSPRENLERILGLVLLAGTIGTYWHLQRCDFIHFDDPFYVTSNYYVRSGINRASAIWAFTTFHSSNWHPLTWLSHMLDCDLFGLNPAGHHLTNLFFHLGSTLLLFLFLRETTNQTWRSFVVAALFSLHPLHVESIAWVSERKDVLSTFFWMLALVAYVRYVRQPGTYGYLLVLLLFSLGLMAKPMVVTFPFVLLLLDYWPLRRTGQATMTPSKGAEWSRLVREKVPFIALSVASSIVTVFAQAEGRAIRTLDVIPLGMRIENALVSYILYISNMLWPHDLSIFYPHPVNSLEPWLILLSAFMLAGLSAVAVQQASSRPYFLVGWLWYLGTLAPVIGLVQVGDQGMADRYTYIPLVGLFVVMVWGLSDLLENLRVRRIFTVPLVCVVCFALIVSTRSQLLYWQSDYTLFEQALKVTKNNYLAHLLLAQVFKMDGDPDKAAFHRRKAVEINPAFVARMYNRWGYYFAEQEQLDEAVADFEEAIQVHPDYASAHNNLGVVLARKGQFNEAIAHFAEALRISPADVRILESLNNAKAERDRVCTSSSNSP
jgi:protein O-mannosyl-transferase